jgi:hypothetical protein
MTTYKKKLNHYNHNGQLKFVEYIVGILKKDIYKRNGTFEKSFYTGGFFTDKKDYDSRDSVELESESVY